MANTVSTNITVLRRLRIIYWNHGGRSNKGDIERLAESYKVIILSKTCFTSTRDFRIKGFDCVDE